jgi:hypothetical protein
MISIGSMIGARKIGAPGRRGKVLQVMAQALLFHALQVVIDGDGQRAAERHVDVGGRRLQAWNQAHQVPRQDEDEHRRDDGEIARTLVADVVVQHALHRGDAVFEHDLQFSGVVDAEAAPRDETQHGDREHDQRRHHEVVGDDVAVRRHGTAERAEQRRRHGAERSIHGLDDPEFVL